MSDTTDSGTPVVSPNTNTEANSEKETGTEPKTFDADYVKELRNESAKYRTERNEAQKAAEAQQAKLSDLENRIKEFEREKLSAEERAKLEFEDSKNLNKTLSEQMKAVQLEASVAKNVVNFSLADVDATLKLMDQSAVQYGEDGRPSNINDVLEATLEKYPFLKSTKKVVTDPGATNPGRQKNNALTREAIANMSHEERVSRMDEISKWMQSGYK